MVEPVRQEQAPHDRILIPPFFQIILIIITSCILASMLYVRVSRFTPLDPTPLFQNITPTSFQRFGSFANEIKTGLYIDEYEKFNFNDNDFIFTGELWFQFDPGLISIATLEKFSFASGQVLYRSEPRTSLLNDKLFVRYNIRVHHSSPLSLVDFPLDNHRLYLQLQHPYISVSESLFTSNYSDFNAESNSEIYGWRQGEAYSRAGYQEDILDELDQSKTSYFPIVLFFIEYSRTSVAQIVTIFLPLLLIFYIILFSLSIQNASTSTSLNAGGVTGILAYRFVIANISPRVGYFMISDYIFFLFLATSAVIFLSNIADIYYEKVHQLAKKLFLVCIHIAINLATGYILFG